MISSGTTTEFCIPDHWVQAAVMVKIRTFKLNPDLFRTTFWTFPDLKSFYPFKSKKVVKSVKNGRKPSKMIVPSGRLCVAIKVGSEASAFKVSSLTLLCWTAAASEFLSAPSMFPCFVRIPLAISEAAFPSFAWCPRPSPCAFNSDVPLTHLKVEVHKEQKTRCGSPATGPTHAKLVCHEGFPIPGKSLLNTNCLKQ